MSKVTKIRLLYLGGAIVLIVLGLLSRRIQFIPDAVGDALWAMMVFCFWRIVLARRKLIYVGIAALVTAFSIEFLQLWTPQWLTGIRATFLGHMILGQGFLWSDLVAYTIGIGIIFAASAAIEKRVENAFGT